MSGALLLERAMGGFGVNSLTAVREAQGAARVKTKKNNNETRNKP